MTESSPTDAAAEPGAPRRRRLFSGIQPTGRLHIGNYLGALRNWVRLQETHEATYCIVDYHAMTAGYEPDAVAEKIRLMAAELFACGIDPERCTLYVQSQVPQHTELAWILSTLTPMGELERMTQFKDKSRQHAKNVNAGLFSYPVLQAADILLFKGEVVPVGEDQKQHLELSRTIAKVFNRRFGKTFPKPRPIIGEGARVIGLDGQAKMSKSLDNQVDLSDELDVQRKKMARAVTDTQRVRRDDPGRPEICNVYALHGFFSPDHVQAEIAEGCRSASIGCYDCKMVLCDHMETVLGPIRERAKALLAEPGRVEEILAHGAHKARAAAQRTMDEVRERTGLGPLR